MKRWGKSHWKTCENDGEKLWNIWEKCGNTMENHGKTMGENYG
jgi:hypothetical protein